MAGRCSALMTDTLENTVKRLSTQRGTVRKEEKRREKKEKKRKEKKNSKTKAHLRIVFALSPFFRGFSNDLSTLR
jgi:hypothetical protein